ncbi:BrnT family toxin [Methylobacterium sp. J-068]|uniref:BrnT family toxin n=1 Tax=Methylobacterium sp. J-068 TaxID=2836649 RepID=UPI001FB8ED24|nr:BrnT family toxin [Methylobacterium sp. J-068]MCJ2034201.1 BrnT family toxin [Methylobacterium sp. J-068]
MMGEAERTVWDDLKSDANLQTRGIGFAGLDEAFDGRFALIREDGRRDYGEARFNMIVAFNGVILNITFTPRDGKQRIISARLANRTERRLYDARQKDC